MCPRLVLYTSPPSISRILMAVRRMAGLNGVGAAGAEAGPINQVSRLTFSRRTLKLPQQGFKNE